jgi:S-layer family protein
MNSDRRNASKIILTVSAVVVLILTSSRLQAQTGCSPNPTPFTDLGGMSSFFCQAVAGAFFSGLTSGTSATTYTPGANVTRDQMAAFITRTLDQSLRRGSQRAALNQFWTTKPHFDIDLGTTAVGDLPQHVQSDGTDLWVVNKDSGTISRVRASDGAVVGEWSGASAPFAPLVAMGKIFITGQANPGILFMIDPTQGSGTVTTLASNLGGFPSGIAFDGDKIWTANGAGSVSIITPGATLPWSVTTVTTGFTSLQGALFDGSNIWVTDNVGTLLKLNSNGAVIQTVSTGGEPRFMTFDGVNIWVANKASSDVTVVRASTGAVLATLTGNGLNSPRAAAFDGERVLVTNIDGNSVSMWKAADLTPLGTFSTGASTQPIGVCSDGLNFWVTLQGADKLVRF